jgi:membrane-associated phospholipid phosphatase
MSMREQDQSLGALPEPDYKRFDGDGMGMPEATRAMPGVDAELHTAVARAWREIQAFEWVAFSYLGLSLFMIGAFPRYLAHPARLIAAQLLAASIIFLLCAAGASAAHRAVEGGETFSTRFWHFWRHWYPHLFFLFCFEELAYLVHLVNPGWQDAKLIAFDHWMFGVHPSVWLEQFATPLRNDLFQLAYLTYFVYLLVLGGILYYRREWHAYWSVMTYSAVGYTVGYLIAAVFPIESPWFAMAGIWRGQLDGGPFTAAINFIEHYGRVRGAAFPSQHVAGSVAALWGAWQHRRWLYWVMLPLVVLMCVSTIWGRYHYVADIFGGILTGTLGYAIGSRLMRNDRTARRGTVALARGAGRLIRPHPQKIFSCLRRFPKVPMLAMVNATRNWFSVRTCPRAMRRYSNDSPQQLPL